MATMEQLVQMLVQQNHEMHPGMQQAMAAIGEAAKAEQAGGRGNDSGKCGFNDKACGRLGKFDGQNWKEIGTTSSRPPSNGPAPRRTAFWRGPIRTAPRT